MRPCAPVLAALVLGLAGAAAAQEATPVAKIAAADPEMAADGRFSRVGEVLVFDTEREDAGPSGIVPGDAAQLIQALRDNPGVTTVELNSSGGDYFEAFEIADAIADFELATHVAGRCESSCAHAFLGGVGRTLARGGKIGFHRTTWAPDAVADYYKGWRRDEGWETVFDMVSWTYEDTQAEVYDRLVFMIDRGVDARFAIETLRQGSEGMWYPSRARLLAAGYLTE